MNYVKLIGFGLVGVLFIALGIRGYHAIYQAGANSVQLAWNDEKLAEDKATATAIAQLTKDRDTAMEANSIIKDSYENELRTAHADAQSLAERLSDAESRASAHSTAAAKAGDRPGATDPSSAPSNEQLTSAVAAVFTECDQNASQLDALIAEIKPQL